MGTVTITFCPPLIMGILIVGGLSLLADSHGIGTGTASSEDLIYFGIDVSLACFGAGLTKAVSVGSARALSTISKGSEVSSGLTEAVHEYQLLNAIQTTSQVCMDTARDLIISNEVKYAISNIAGWGVN